jgi:5'(3')-deoxyribonucleotidase
MFGNLINISDLYYIRMRHNNNNMSEMKKIVYIDMDGVLVDLGKEFDKWFESHPHLVKKFEKCPDHIPGIFRNPPPMEGAIEAIKKLAESGKYELFIATAAPWGNPEAATDKRYWIETHFGELFHKKMFVTHRKDLLMGDYLIDDRIKNGAGEFKGELLRFGWAYETETWNEYPNWESILKKLL